MCLSPWPRSSNSNHSIVFCPVRKKKSCVCIKCQNPHLLLQAVNRYRKSKHLDGHEWLTKYLERLNAGEKFDEQSEKSSYTYHKYERVMESYTKKDGTPGEYKRVARVDYHEPVKNICKKLLETGDTYLKHRTYVDNVSTVFLERKSVYYG